MIIFLFNLFIFLLQKIVGERFQGTTVLCKTEDGDVNIKMLYTEKSYFSSGSGDIILGGSHGNISAESKRGNLTVGMIADMTLGIFNIKNIILLFAQHSVTAKHNEI